MTMPPGHPGEAQVAATPGRMMTEREGLEPGGRHCQISKLL
jgi:hypothetical protein